MKSPHRIAGNLALDFANTISWRDTGREVDHLASPEGLAAWASESHLEILPPDERMASEARAVRDAIGAVGLAFASGTTPPTDALARLRDAAAAALSRAELAGDPLRPRFGEDDQLLGTVAWSAMELFGGPETHRIKMCPSHDCRWLFVDRSKSGSRRWCEMATCGNRAKKLAMSASSETRLKAD